jgi:hypothetical protein
MKLLNAVGVVCLGISSCTHAPEAQTNASYDSQISYFGADWGPDTDTIYFLKQIVVQQKADSHPPFTKADQDALGSHIWFCKMKPDGSQKTEIAELWQGQHPSVDEHSAPVWLEVNAATSNAAFSVEYGMGTVGIWVLSLGGTNLHRPFELPWNEHEKVRGDHPSWSPDGTKLVYHEQADTNRIVLFDLVHKKRQVLTEGIEDLHPAWSPNGDWIAYTHYLRYDNTYADRRIWLIRPDASEQRPLLNDKSQPIRGWWPSWSPSGDRISLDTGLLVLAGLQTNAVQQIDPLYIMGIRSPWLLSGHHWGKKGWLLNTQGRLVVINESGNHARTVACGGIYPHVTGTAGYEPWGIAPFDLQGKRKTNPADNMHYWDGTSVKTLEHGYAGWISSNKYAVPTNPPSRPQQKN